MYVQANWVSLILISLIFQLATKIQGTLILCFGRKLWLGLYLFRYFLVWLALHLRNNNTGEYQQSSPEIRRIYSFIHSIIHSKIHSVSQTVSSIINSFFHSFIHSFIQSFIHLFIHLFVYSSMNSSIHSRIHSLIYSIIY